MSFLGLCTGDCCFAADDPEPHDLLPVDDKAWIQDVSPHILLLSLELLTVCS